MENYSPPMHANCTSCFDILEQKDAILWCTVDRRHEVSGLICSKITGLIHIDHKMWESEDH